MSTGSFEDFAGDYERHAEAGAYNALYDRPAVLDLMGDVAGLRLLDAGCGPGFYAAELVARGAAQVVGFDASPEMVRLAGRRVPSGATFRAHRLGEPLDWLEEASVDGALLALVIHHVDDRVAALRQIQRALRPGGFLVVSTHHPTSDWIRLGGSYFTVEKVHEIWQGSWRVDYWRQPLSATCDEFAQAGFLIERLVEPRPSPGMADRFPDDYAKLLREPGFIDFRLRKPPVQ
ncbi:MAG: class I SAM-dependent methyltransferase [Acidimicrobiales bacterium]